MLYLLDIVVVYSIDCGLEDCPWTLVRKKGVQELVKWHWFGTGDKGGEDDEAGVDIIICECPLKFGTAQSQGYQR